MRICPNAPSLRRGTPFTVYLVRTHSEWPGNTDRLGQSLLAAPPRVPPTTRSPPNLPKGRKTAGPAPGFQVQKRATVDRRSPLERLWNPRSSRSWSARSNSRHGHPMIRSGNPSFRLSRDPQRQERDRGSGEGIPCVSEFYSCKSLLIDVIEAREAH